MNTRVYQHASWNWITVILMLPLFVVGAAVLWVGENAISAVLILALVAPVTAFSAFSLTAKTIISDDEITTQNFLGRKTLRWRDIARVSGKEYGLKLHNFDGDVVVTPNQQVPNYEEVIEIIGAKRPDLFSPREYAELPRNWNGLLSLCLAALALFAAGTVWHFQSGESVLPVATMFAAGVTALGFIFLAPQSVLFEGDLITIRYLFRETRVAAREIASVQLGYSQMRNGKNYYIMLHLRTGQRVKITNIKPSLPIAYHVLKNWHSANTRS